MSIKRKIILFIAVLGLVSLSFGLNTYGYLEGGFIFLFLFFGLIGLLFFSHFEEPNNFFNYYSKHKKLKNYDKSLLFIYAKIIEIDGKVSEKELLLSKKIIKKNLGDNYLREHFEFLKSSLDKEINISLPLWNILDNFGNHYSTILINNLIRIAVADRFLSNKEEAYILKIAGFIGIQKRALETLFNLHIFTRESRAFNTKNNEGNRIKIEKSYQILDVNVNSTLEEVKSSYRKMAKIFHPDKVTKLDKNKEEATKQFRLITDAYETIKKEKG